MFHTSSAGKTEKKGPVNATLHPASRRKATLGECAYVPKLNRNWVYDLLFSSINPFRSFLVHMAEKTKALDGVLHFLTDTNM